MDIRKIDSAVLMAVAGGSITVGVALLAASAATPAAAAGADAASGQQPYVTNCGACHQATGQGLPGVFPPLTGDPVVGNPDATEHIRSVLFGVQGKTLNNVKYATPMPPWTQLSDKDIAAIINYERTSWGNHGKTITSSDVAAIRAKGK